MSGSNIIRSLVVVGMLNAPPNPMFGPGTQHSWEMVEWLGDESREKEVTFKRDTVTLKS